MRTTFSERIVSFYNEIDGLWDDISSYALEASFKALTDKAKLAKRSKKKSRSTTKGTSLEQYAPTMHYSGKDRIKLQNKLIALQSRIESNNLGLTPDEVLLIFDTGASISISNSKDDFIGEITPITHMRISGIAKGLEVKGYGTVEYTVLNDDGATVTMRIDGVLYVPGCPARLICPQQLISQSNKRKATTSDTYSIELNESVLRYEGNQITIPYADGNNLPILVTEPGMKTYTNYLCRECETPDEPLAFLAHPKEQTQTSEGEAAKEATDTATDGETNDNLTENQRIMLKWHHRLGHREMSRIQSLARIDGVLPKTAAEAIKKVRQSDFPICAGCSFGKQRRRAADYRGKIDEGHTAPGAKVSGDMLEAGCDGLIPTTRGRRSKKKHHVATLWIDHFSRFVFAYLHDSTSAGEAVMAKLEFEKFARRFNVEIEGYHTDNQPFTSKEFRAAIDEAGQDLTNCGVGAHHQNGIIEAKIGSLTRWARTMLLHAMNMWPGVITEEFWTFALKQAIAICNAMIQDGNEKCPWELFTDEECPLRLKDFQVFGCPVYVLDKALQDGNDISKWKKRSKLGIYVGHSPHHSGNVAMIYNPETGHVSPQYHVVFDNGFTTVVKNNRAQTKRNMDKAFEKLFKSDRWKYTDEYAESGHRYHFDSLWSNDDDYEQTNNDTNDKSEPDNSPESPATKRVRFKESTPTASAKTQNDRLSNGSQPTTPEGTGDREGDVTSAGPRESFATATMPASTPAYRPGNKIIVARPTDVEVSIEKTTSRSREISTQTLDFGDNGGIDLPSSSHERGGNLIAGPQQVARQPEIQLIDSQNSRTDFDDCGRLRTVHSRDSNSRSQSPESRPDSASISNGTIGEDPLVKAAPPTGRKKLKTSLRSLPRRSSKRRRAAEKNQHRLPSYPTDTGYKAPPKSKTKDTDLTAIHAMMSRLEGESDTDETASLTDLDSDTDMSDDELEAEKSLRLKHHRDRKYDAMVAYHLAQTQTVDDGSTDGELNIDNPLVFNTMLQAMNNKEDILTHGQMLKIKDAKERQKFFDAQIPEIEGLEEMQCFSYHRRSSLPPGTRLLRAVWSYRRKRRPDGTILKYKARLCADGSQQRRGIDYEENYAPVVAWSTVRLLMVIASVLGLNMRQIDFTQAFPQAAPTEDVYMHLPQNWECKDADGNDDYVIKLERNLYGTATGARNWYQKLSGGLLGRGFVQSKIDPCLFLRDDCMVVVYTDDCICFSRESETATQLISDLKTDGFLLKDEGDAKDFLGVRIETDEATGKIEMTQTGLIESILHDLGLTNTPKTKSTPASGILHKDENGAGRIEYDKWNYRSVIGKMNYLAMNTRPDIAFAVHQCAKFCNNPKLLHEKAVKHIGQYLAGTAKQGIILNPDPNGKLDAYVDSDFAGRWHQKYAQLRESVLSRTGFVITYCNCPVTWSSKLQTEIALSTTEAEYIALSTMCRTLLPMRMLLKEINKHTVHKLHVNDSRLSTNLMNSNGTGKLVVSEVFEDNSGCVVLANDDQYRPRTKHLAIKWHHFKDQVRNGNLKVTKVDTKINWADIFTKAVDKTTFERLRKLMMGW